MRTNRYICLATAGTFVICATASGCSKKAVDEAKDKYMTLEEIYATADEVLDNDYENLTMPSKITLDETDALYTVDGKWSGYADESESKNNICGIAADLFDVSITVEDIQTNLYDEEYYEYIDENLYIESHIKYNFTAMDTSISVEDYFGGKNVVNINIDRNESLDDVYELPGGECSVKSALEYCDSQIPDLQNYIHPDEALRAKSIIVTQLSDGKYVYRFIYEKLYKGVAFDEGCGYDMMGTGFSKPSFLCVVMDAPEHIRNVTVCYQNDYAIETLQECEDRFVSLEYACDILSAFIARYNKFEVSDIDIKYCCITYDDGEKMPEEAQIRPMWTFVLNEKFSSSASMFNDNERICGYVDMITGEVFVVDNITNYEYFNLSKSDE